MRTKGRIGRLTVGAVLIAAAGFSSCTKMIQPEQLQELRTLRQKEAQLTKSIAEKEALKVKLQKELESRQQETKRCNEKRAFVQEKLNNFPEQLGAPLPEAPPPPPEPVKKDTKKKSK
ncbi:MAG: hypothetical protein K1X91_12070 [Bacteriodetes bacterium]|nr:hypothetical protein [Bacteroidota bacterium]